MKILIVSDSILPTVRMVALEPFHKLLKESHDIQWKYRSLAKIDNKLINWADLIWIIRSTGPDAEKIVIRAKLLGKKMIYDLDDNLGKLPVYSKLSLNNGATLMRKSIARLVSNVDILRIYSVQMQIELQNLKNSYVRRTWANFVDNLNGNLFMLETQSLAIYSQIEKKPIRILYASSNDFSSEFEAILSQLFTKLPYEFEFLSFQENRPKSLPQNLKFTKIRKVSSTAKFNELIFELAPAIGLGPIVNSDFYKAKTDAKLRDLAIVGIPGIYSDCEPYKSRITAGKNGYLATDLSEWQMALASIIEVPGKYFQLMTSVAEFAHQNYSMSEYFSELLSDFNSLKIQRNTNWKVKGGSALNIKVLVEIADDNFRGNFMNQLVLWDISTKNLKHSEAHTLHVIECDNPDFEYLLKYHKSRKIIRVHVKECECREKVDTKDVLNIHLEESSPSNYNYQIDNMALIYKFICDAFYNAGPCDLENSFTLYVRKFKTRILNLTLEYIWRFRQD